LAILEARVYIWRATKIVNQLTILVARQI
jgi:hypothetical protein